MCRGHRDCNPFGSSLTSWRSVLMPQDVRGLAGDGPVPRGWDPGWWKHPSLPTSWCLSGPIQGHPDATPLPPCKGRAGNSRWVGLTHCCPPRDTCPGNDPHLLCLPPLQSYDWECPSRVRTLHSPGYSASASVSMSIHAPSPTTS